MLLDGERDRVFREIHLLDRGEPEPAEVLLHVPVLVELPELGDY